MSFFLSCGLLRVQGKDLTKLDIRIRKSIDYLDLLQADPSKAIPAQVLAKAEGIIIMRQYKVGFVFGAKGGGGVALVKDKHTGKWSAPAFVSSGEGSWGFQIGGEKSDSVILLMDRRGMAVLDGGAVKIGVDVSGTAGPVAGGGQANFDNLKDPILVYSNKQGLYAGASIQGGGVFPDDKANMAFYGMPMRQVHLSGKARITPSGKILINNIDAFSREPKPGAPRLSPAPAPAPKAAPQPAPASAPAPQR